MTWTGATTNVQLTNGPNSFSSNVGDDYMGIHTPNWDAERIEFHAGSEHTINGKRFDLEMNTIFKADPFDQGELINAASVGILFSVNDFNIKLSKAEQMVIDTFFSTLDWDNIENPKVNLITYGDMMNMVDLNNRWIYKGSSTTPPCASNVYWNVLHTVYPIR